MGKRRVRNLHALGESNLAGFDPREDRRLEVATKYGLAVYSSYEEALLAFKPDVLIISTSPSLHMDYALPAAEKNIHCFIEASVVDAERIGQLAAIVSDKPLVMAPSCTMRYYPGPRKIKSLIESGIIGRPLVLSYLTGQYLPDWHPWEDINDFYVSSRETGGCREIVPFELTWLNDIFGSPQPLACAKGNFGDLSADIDDVYSCVLSYPGGLIASLTIEVVSRPHATRELRILGTNGQIVFSADEKCVRHISVGDADWTRTELASGTIEKGYINPEEPYISEMKDFIDAVAGKARFSNSLDDDIQVLNLLSELENLSEKTL
jgi:predicted dehydrogenase